ncbi:hypothetical protein [Desulfovibrio desulfuricans]|uniref:hypothetical protein n=1 Tax=Desulfovibrio desulfuricans TaxID=876 RepID=UPI0035AEB5DE
MDKIITPPASVVKPTSIELDEYPCSQGLINAALTLAMRIGWLQATIEQSAHQFEEVARHA